MIKKTVFIIMVFFAVCFPAYGMSAQKPIEIYINQSKVNSDVPPLIIEGRTLVPLRVISENLGASVHWNSDNRTVKVTTSSKIVILKIDDTKALIDGETITLDVPAKIINGRTLVPIRFIAESLGAEVSWNNTLRRVSVNGGIPKIIGFSYEVLDGRQSVVIRGDLPLVYSRRVVAEEDKLVLDIEGQMLIENNAIHAYDNYIDKAFMSVIDVKTPLTRVAIDMKPGASYHINQSADKKSISVSFSNVLNKVNADRQDDELIVRLSTVNSPTINHFFLTNPDRLVVDMKGTVLSAKAPAVPGNDYVKDIRVSQFSTDPDTVRVVFDLKNDANYQIYQDKNITTVMFSSVHTVKDLFVDSQGEKTIIEVVAEDEIGYEVKAYRDAKKIKLIVPGVAVSEKLLRQGKLSVRDGIIDNIEIQKIKGSKNYDLEITINLDNFADFELVTVPPSSVARLVIYKSAAKNKLVVIDPGHGGSEPGAVSGDILEKNLNLDIGLRLKKVLEGRGVKVFMTREDDIYVSTYARASMANEIGADVFLSIHNNASTSPSGCGTETLYYPDPKNEALARAIQKSMTGTLGLRDRGIVSRPGLVVTRETKMPSALVEVAFMTNKDELSLLMTEDFRQKAAEAIADGILNYLSGKAD